MDLTVHATLDAIKADAVAVLGEMAKKAEAYAIVEEVNHPLICVTLDQCRFHAMVSGWDALEKADGKKIFIWHLNGMENMSCGAAYNSDEKRLWSGAPGDCLDHKRYVDALKKTVSMAMCAPLRCFVPTITSSPMRRTSRRQPRSHAPMWRLIADFSGGGATFIKFCASISYFSQQSAQPISAGRFACRPVPDSHGHLHDSDTRALSQNWSYGYAPHSEAAAAYGQTLSMPQAVADSMRQRSCITAS